MSTKPTIALARWATGAGASVVDPTSGERDSGFIDGQLIDQATFNALLKQFYLWAQYLSEGDVGLNNVSIASTGSIAFPAASGGGTATIRAPSAISGANSYVAYLPVKLPGLGFTYPLLINGSGQISYGPANADYVGAAAGQLITGVGGGAAYDGSAWNLGTSGLGQGPTWSIPTRANATITTINAYVTRGSGTGAIQASYSLRDLSNGGTVAYSGTATLSSGSGAQTISISTGLPFTVPANCALSVTVANSGAGTGNFVHGVGIIY